MSCEWTYETHDENVTVYSSTYVPDAVVTKSSVILSEDGTSLSVFLNISSADDISLECKIYITKQNNTVFTATVPVYTDTCFVISNSYTEAGSYLVGTVIQGRAFELGSFSIAVPEPEITNAPESAATDAPAPTETTPPTNTPTATPTNTPTDILTPMFFFMLFLFAFAITMLLS